MVSLNFDQISHISIEICGQKDFSKIIIKSIMAPQKTKELFLSILALYSVISLKL